MANQKISEMQRITETTPDDKMYIVQDGVPSHVTIGTLFGKMPDVLLSGSMQLDTIEDVITNGGAIGDTHVVYALATDNADRVFTISSGTTENPLPLFMIKVLYLKSEFSGKAIITGGFVDQIEQVEMNRAGQTAVLMSTPLGWVYLSGTATVVAASLPSAPDSDPFGFDGD